MIITPTFTSGFDANFGVNASAAKAAWIAAAKVFTDPIHINITVVISREALGPSR